MEVEDSWLLLQLQQLLTRTPVFFLYRQCIQVSYELPFLCKILVLLKRVLKIVHSSEVEVCSL